MNLSDSSTAGRLRITRTSAAEAVFEALRHRIESGADPVGTKLPSEAVLGEAYGVSRSVVREALRSCATLGLTRTETGRGTFVVAQDARPDLDLGSYSATELFEARPHLEIPAARLAAARRSTTDIERLTGLLDAMEAEDDPAAWVQLDTDFHGAIAAASGNRVFARMVGGLRDAMAQQSQTVNLTAGRTEPSQAEHRIIVAAIVNGDPDAAAAAMRDHLDAVHDAVTTITRNTSE
ncbi:FadR/GntR family transcriptional regulator [Gordonia phthalatica]|uniref:GntR family transcriptional regulator n=1 Tax=Gordonia phthalatica TaxID=1136941 RepID=A0A0N9N9E1_9ACTN|nr:FadR/GntR family transcriptional regulator [Gordonia phthalatica]ALG83830.1 GntR family transcriptional regulator [Gordonia phthalatica]